MIDFEGAQWDPGIPMLEIGDGRTINYAQWYGFPACCHNYFWYQRKLLFGPHSPEEIALGFIGTGYRPCLDCQKLSSAEIYKGICERRWDDLPFPIQADDFAYGKMLKTHLDNAIEFVASMRARGVVLDPKLGIFIKQQQELHDDPR